MLPATLLAGNQPVFLSCMAGSMLRFLSGLVLQGGGQRITFFESIDPLGTSASLFIAEKSFSRAVSGHLSHGVLLKACVGMMVLSSSPYRSRPGWAGGLRPVFYRLQ